MTKKTENLKAQTIKAMPDENKMIENVELTQEIEKEIENYSDVGVIETETEDEDDEDNAAIPIVYQEIEELKALCSQSGITSVILLTFEDLKGFTGIQEHIRLIEERLGVPTRAPEKDIFIKVSANKDGFQAFKYPDIALVDGVVCAVFHNHIQPIEQALKNCKTLKIFKKNTGTSAEYYLTLGEQQAEYLPMRISVKPSDMTHNEFQMIRVKYLQGICNNYTFARSWLDDGIYTVSDFKSVEGRFLIGTILGRQYYLSQSQFDNLKINEADGRPLNLIIDGNRTYMKDGNPITVRNEYIEGHRPSMFFSEFMETAVRELVKNEHFGELSMSNTHAFVQKYLSEVSNGVNDPKIVALVTTDLVMYDTMNAAKIGKVPEKKGGKTPRLLFKVEPAIEIRLRGVMSCKPHPIANKWGFQLVLELNGEKYTSTPNHAIATARENRMFDNVNFDDDENPVQLIIHEIEYWESKKNINGKEITSIDKKYVLKWHTPTKAQNRDVKYASLAAKLSKSAQ